MTWTPPGKTVRLEGSAERRSSQQMMHDWDRYWNHGMTAGGWLMVALMIVFVAAVIVGVIFLVRALSGATGSRTAAATTPSGPSVPAAESPQEILKRRYAAGEIDREEYLQKLKDL